MNYILYDDPSTVIDLHPITYTRPISRIRLGILNIQEKWEYYLNQSISLALDNEWMQNQYPPRLDQVNCFINSKFMPSQALLSEIKGLKVNQVLKRNHQIIAFLWPSKELSNIQAVMKNVEEGFEVINSSTSTKTIQYPWHIFQYTSEEIRHDFDLLTKHKKSKKIDDPHTIMYQPENIHIEEGVQIKAAVLNAEKGPIYIGKNVHIQEYAVLHGNTYIGEGSVIHMGAKIKGDTSIGPYCKIGGEVSNSVILGYSNKAHDGFLGNSVIGEWCNLGADTNTSNLKNNYSNVKIWNDNQNDFMDTGSQFCGLIMGDHSKSGINTMFNTGTVVGVNSNVFGGGFPPKSIPSFFWGGKDGFVKYNFEKALEVIGKMMERRNCKLTDDEVVMLRKIAENTKACVPQ